MIDYICYLKSAFLVELNLFLVSNFTIFSHTTIQPIDGELQFAIIAKEVGFDQTTLILKIGDRVDNNKPFAPDLRGSMVIDLKNHYGIAPLAAITVAIAPNIESRRVFLTYLASNRRLMVVEPLANTANPLKDISTKLVNNVRQTSILYISGYALLHSILRATAIELIGLAKSYGGRIAVDFVPQNFSKYISLTELRGYIGSLIDWIFMEIPLVYELSGFVQLVCEKGLPMVNLLLKTIVFDLPIGRFSAESRTLSSCHWNGNQRYDFYSMRRGQDYVSIKGFALLVQAEFFMEQKSALSIRNEMHGTA